MWEMSSHIMCGKMVRCSRRVPRRIVWSTRARVFQGAFQRRRQRRESVSRQRLFDSVSGFMDDRWIEGCCLEFGCAEGSSLVGMFEAVHAYRRSRGMLFCVCDSFAGLA